MLHTETLTDETLRLLRALMFDSFLHSFNLVGGTALSLYLGHRRSIDLDLFSKEAFDVVSLRRHLADEYGFKERFSEKETLKGDVKGVFIDLIRYDYPAISPLTVEQGIRLTGIPDLLAMKLSAIADSGEREKDFVDIAFFSSKVSLREMLGYYEAKFKGASAMPVLKALLYYNDINRNEPLMLTQGRYNWKAIERRLADMVKDPNRVFGKLPV